MPRLTRREALITSVARALWATQAVFPLAGLAIVALRWQRLRIANRSSLALLVTSLLWLGVVVLVLRTARGRAFVSRRAPHLIMAAVAWLFTIPLAELALTVVDAAGVVPLRPLSRSPWAFIPKTPPLVDYVSTDDEAGMLFQPNTHDHNGQGFRSRHDFSSPPLAERRILLLGDSFAWGASAPAGRGFAEQLETRLGGAGKPVVLWNTGIPGTGQNQQIRHLKTYFPVLRPQTVVLAFYEGNDFYDNALPLGQFYVYKKKDSYEYVQRFAFADGKVQRFSLDEAWQRAHDYPWERRSALLALRIPSLIRRFLDTKVPSADKIERDQRDAEAFRKIQLAETRRLLGEMKSYVEAGGAQLLVVVIPRYQTLSGDDPRRDHEAALEILRSLSIPFVDTTPSLRASDYNPDPDGHWNEAGHRKVAEILAARLGG